MKTSSTHIELKNYKLLLTQLIIGLVERLDDTGFKPNCKRDALTQELHVTADRLYRELRRDTTLAHSAEVKETLFIEMYKKAMIPEWILRTVIEILCDEQYQLVHSNKKAS